ncbi:MAG: hypothetical protein GF364_20630 [Candidatus Lokiarchaeota archaeon]|nr:hypothetical protein [Candidatus Lokiarchaeota archaeon]
MASQIESDKVSEVFFFNKQNFQKNLLFQSIEITPKGKKLLSIIFDENVRNMKGQKTQDEKTHYEYEYSLSQLREISEIEGFDMDLPAMSRLVSSLIKKCYLNERRVGRKRLVSLTPKGLIFCPVSDLKNHKTILFDKNA